MRGIGRMGSMVALVVLMVALLDLVLLTAMGQTTNPPGVATVPGTTLTHAVPGVAPLTGANSGGGFGTNGTAPNFNLWVDGDSLTAGPITQGIASWADMQTNMPFLKGRIGSYTNLAVNGERFSIVSNRLASIILPGISAQGGNNVVAMWTFANDYWTGVQSPELNLTNLCDQVDAYWAAVRAAGAKAVGFTCMKRSNYGQATNEVRRAYINARMRASTNLDALIDVDTLFPDTTAGQVTYDGTHLTNASQVALSYVVASALEAIIFGELTAAGRTTNVAGNGLAYVYEDGMLMRAYQPAAVVTNGNTVLTNLQIWLRADAQAFGNGTSQNWPDSSGNGNNATTSGTKPTFYTGIINGQPAYFFTNTMTLTTPYAAAAGNFTTFIVFQNLDTTGAYGMVVDKSFASGFAFGSQYDGSRFINNTLGATAYLTVSSNSWTVGAATRNGTDFWIYGPDSAVNSNTCVSISIDTSALVLGSTQAETMPFVGYIAEFLFYDTLLSDADRAVVMTYLRTKYALP
jgi:hypothetical protein